MPKPIIFDVDGTLVDSVTLHAKAWHDAFRDFGHDVSVEAAGRQIGKGGDKLLEHFLSSDQIAKDGEALESHRAAILKERYLPQVVAFPKVRDLIRHLKEKGHAVALASSAKGDELQTYKQIAEIDDLIDVETSSSDAEHSKPDPDIFEAALERLGRPDPAQVLVVGDTPYDAQAAAKAGMRTIGLTGGGWSADELREAGCIAIYTDPTDLLAHYASSPLADAD